MAIKEIEFYAIDSRCKHGDIMQPDQEGCVECEFEKEVLRMKLPFSLRALYTSYGLTKDHNYTVKVIVLEGETATDRGPGVMVEGKDGNVYPMLFNTSRFGWPAEEKKA